MALEEVVLNKLVLKDIRKLSTLHQTSSIEAFHSLLIQYAPKMGAFSFRECCAGKIYTMLYANFFYKIRSLVFISYSQPTTN